MQVGRTRRAQLASHSELAVWDVYVELLSLESKVHTCSVKELLQVCTSWLGHGSWGGAAQVTPEWERLTAHIEADPDSKRLLGCACPTGLSGAEWPLVHASSVTSSLVSAILCSRHQARAR